MEFGERFFMKEAQERASGVVKRDWELKLTEARYLGQHTRTGAMMGISADGIFCGRLGHRLPEAERWDQTGWQDLKGVPWNLRPTGVPEPEVNIEAQPGAAEAERRKRGRPEPVRARDETQQGVRERNEPNSTRHLQRLHQGQMQMRTTASKTRELEGKTLEGENSV